MTDEELGRVAYETFQKVTGLDGATARSSSWKGPGTLTWDEQGKKPHSDAGVQEKWIAVAKALREALGVA